MRSEPSRHCPRIAGLLLAIALGGALPASALILVFGTEPWHNDATPLGSEAVANLPGRIGGWEGPPYGGGEFHFVYRCASTEAFNQAVQTFAAIRTPRLEIVLHNGPGHDPILARADETDAAANVIDWTFTVCQPASFHRLYNDPLSHFDADTPFFRQPWPAPKLDVYLRPGGPIDWAKVQVPAKVQVIDQRASAAPVPVVDGGVVQADVYDMATGRPVPDAALVLTRWNDGQKQYEAVARAAGDPHGSILLRKVPKGAFTVRAAAPGYAPRPCAWIDNRIDGYHALEVQLSKTAAISGVVTDLDGKPIPGVKVMANDIMGIDGRGYGSYSGRENPATVSDQAGRFRIDSLPTGFTCLHCQSDSFYASSLELYAVPSDDVQIKMIGTGTVRGKVTFAAGQTRPAEINISIDPPGKRIGKWSGSRTCQADGSFEFTAVPAGEYCLHSGPEVGGRDLQPADSSHGPWIAVKPGATVEVEVPYH